MHHDLVGQALIKLEASSTSWTLHCNSELPTVSPGDLS